MQIVLVVSPAGLDLVVSQVVLDDGRTVWSSSPGGPRMAKRRVYHGLDDAIAQNSRATTTAMLVEVPDEDAAIALLGKSPSVAPVAR